jgi:hypothetical protein
MAKRAVDGVNLLFFSPLSYPDRQGKSRHQISTKGEILNYFDMDCKRLAFSWLSWLIMLSGLEPWKADFLGDRRMPKGLVFDLFSSAWLRGSSGGLTYVDVTGITLHKSLVTYVTTYVAIQIETLEAS